MFYAQGRLPGVETSENALNSNTGGRILHTENNTKGQSICFLLQKLQHTLSPYLMLPWFPSCDGVSYIAAVPCPPGAR